jgi:hypothetical protein
VPAPPYTYHYLPERASRPGAAKSARPPREGVFLPHAPCPFDGEDFVQEREILRHRRGARSYHLVSNRYPVTPFHFLAIRPHEAPAATLPQCLHGPEEIEDFLLLLGELGEPFRCYFNSNRGADDSQSGSSVNHWHFQLFLHRPAYPQSLLAGPAEFSAAQGSLRVGQAVGWPASHRFADGGPGDEARAAALLWEWVGQSHARNAAYNLEMVALPARRFRAFLFPRRPAPPAEVPGAGMLSADFGGWELSGDIVIPTRELLDWVREHPDEARRLTEKRLRETTRPVEG